MQRFENKIVLVTGAGEGIGQLTAAEFVKEGATVIVSDRNQATGAATAARLRDEGSPDTIFIKADVSREADMTALFRADQAAFSAPGYRHQQCRRRRRSRADRRTDQRQF